MNPIVTVTVNPCLDINTSVDRVVVEAKLRCKPPVFEPGGGGLNVSRAIKKLGGNSSAIYLCGGYIGEKLEALLSAEDIDQRPIQIADSNRENFVVMDETTGEQFRFGMPGPQVEQAEYGRILDLLRQADPAPEYVIVSGSLPPGVPPDFIAEITELSKSRGAKAILDTSGEALSQAVKIGAFLLKPNLRELGDLLDREIEDEDQLQDAVENLIALGGCEAIVVSIGAGGAFFGTREGCEVVRSPTVPIKSKVGAGDSMVGGIVYRLSEGAPLSEAVRYGVAAGAAAVMSPGTELCSRDDTDRLYKQLIEFS